MWVGAVLPKVDALPGAEDETAADDGDGEIDGGEGGADMGRHVVRAFGGVFEESVAVWDKAIEEAVEVATDFRIGVFLDEERGAGVTEMQGAEAGLEASFAQGINYLIGDLVEPSTFGADGGFLAVLAQHGRHCVVEGGVCHEVEEERIKIQECKGQAGSIRYRAASLVLSKPCLP